MCILIFLRKWIFLTLCSIQPTLSIINIQRDLWELNIVDKVSFIKISQNVTKFLLFKLALEYRYTAVITLVSLSSVHNQFSSVAQSCPTLCDPVNRSMPGLPIHHQLPEFTQTLVLWVGDAIQPSHPCRPLFLLPSIFPNIRLFSNESALHIRWPKYWSLSFNISPSDEYSGLISFRMDWLDLFAVQGTLKSLLQPTV